MVGFDNFSSLEYLLSVCGGVSVHIWVGMYKYTCIYIGVSNAYIENALGTKKTC